MPVFWERMQWQPIPKQIYKLNSSKFKIYVLQKKSLKEKFQMHLSELLPMLKM